jgi:hypothetical protein
VLTDAGSNPVWKPNISQKVISAQLGRDKIKIFIMQKNKKSGVLLGEGVITGVPLLTKKNEWVQLTHDLTCDQKPAGTFTLKCKYRPANEDEAEDHQETKATSEKMSSSMQSSAKDKAKEEEKAKEKAKEKEIDALNDVIKDMKTSQKDLLARLGGMENTISKQLQQVGSCHHYYKLLIYIRV